MSLVDSFDLALCLYREARGAVAAMIAICHVILNRVNDPRWPNTPSEVVRQPLQFSSFNSTDVNAKVYPNFANKLEWKSWCEACKAVENPGLDPTGGATAYHSGPRAALSPVSQKFFNPAHQTVVIGPFTFYKV